MAKQTDNSQSTIVNSQFFEIVNWKKAQPRMVDDSAVWLKLYTSVLDHDGFEGLDDSARVLIVLLWAYAARSGRHVFPADPAWLRRRIPTLNSDPNLGPLLEASDVYGNPTPFIAYCEPPVPEGAEKTAKKPARKPAAKKPAKKATKKERQTDREREREKEEILTDFEKERKKEKTRVKTRVSKETEQTDQAGCSRQPETHQPVNPNDSEAGAAEAHIVPKPPQSAHSGPQVIGAIIGQRFQDHWADPDAEAFGWEIVEALGYSKDRDNPHSRAEWGMFAKWWWKIKKKCPAMALDDLRATAIRKAQFVNSPKCKSARNKSKVWNYIMKGETGHGSDRQARASP